MALEITKDNFDSEVLQSSRPVLVDFWAEWCGPCKMIGPVVEAVAKDMDGKATVGKVNVDHEQDLARKFNIVSIPTLLFFKDGEVKDQVIGANVTQDSLKQRLEALA